jgi:hypothetical protein
MTPRFPLLAAVFALLSLAHAEDISLFNGKDLSAWKEPHGTWSVVGGVALDKNEPKNFTTQPGEGVFLNTISGKAVNLFSKPEHGDAEIHVEFCVSKGSNSGVYVMGRYEVQIFDSFGKAEIAEHDCGAIYQRWKDGKGYEGHTPKVNASKAPGEWQTFDISFRAPRFNAAGEKTENAKFIKVVHNGKTIHENVEVTGPTRGSTFEKEAPTGPIALQGDHGPVAFRSLKITTR